MRDDQFFTWISIVSVILVIVSSNEFNLGGDEYDPDDGFFSYTSNYDNQPKRKPHQKRRGQRLRHGKKGNYEQHFETTFSFPYLYSINTYNMYV